MKIDTLDNPGWSLEIDLTDTALRHKSFAHVKRDYEDETERITCFLRRHLTNHWKEWLAGYEAHI